MKEEELWMKKIKERLEEHSEPLPVSGWERLEKELPNSLTLVPGQNKQTIFRRWAMSAAAVLLVAVSSVSLWLLNSPVGDEMRNASTQTLAIAPDGLPGVAMPDKQAEQTEQVHSITTSARRNQHRIAAVQPLQKSENSSHPLASAITTEKAVAVAAVNEQVAQQSTDESGHSATTQVSTSKETAVRRPSGRDKLHLPIEKNSTSKSQRWSVGMGVGNMGGLLGTNSSNPNAYLMGTNRLNLADTSSGLVAIPNGQEVVFENGLPYLRSNRKEVVDAKHSQPVSFGVSVRKSLPQGFSLETGLMYTLLSSDVLMSGSSERVDQKLHYVGIPIRANWNFLDKKNITLYVSAGGAVEKCVYGKIGGDSETVKPLQLSVMGAVGAQYNISHRVGIYIEPGISYFFDDGSKVQTIRKEPPCNFTLQAGLRLTY